MHPWNKCFFKKLFFYFYGIVLSLCFVQDSFARSPDKQIFWTAFQDLPPKYFKTSDGQYRGLCYDILREAEARLQDIEIRTYGFHPWKRIQAELAEGRLDLVFGVARNKKREAQYFFVRQPLYDVNHVAASRINDKVLLSSLEDLKTFSKTNRILTNRGSATARYLKKLNIQNIDDRGPDLLQNLKKLQAGRGRLFYFHDLGIYWHLKHSEDLKIKVLPVSFNRYYHYLALHPRHEPTLGARFATVLKDMKDDGTLQKLRQRYLGLERSLKHHNMPDLTTKEATSHLEPNL